MARPRKPKSERFSEEIRIKVRPGLKALVQARAAAHFLEEAAYVRSILEKDARDSKSLAPA